MLVVVLSISCIDMWQGKIIVWAGPIKISIIDAYAYFPIFLWHGKNVGNLIKVGYGSKKTTTTFLLLL